MLDLLAIVLSGVVTYVTRVIFLVSKKLRPPKRTLALPDLEQSKAAVLNTLTSKSG